VANTAHPSEGLWPMTRTGQKRSVQ